MHPRPTIAAFDDHLQARGLRLEAIVVGGAALALLAAKLFALCDRGTDLPDCLALAPSATELADACPWVADQDAHPGWPDHVAATLADLARRLGHGL